MHRVHRMVLTGMFAGGGLAGTVSAEFVSSASLYNQGTVEPAVAAYSVTAAALGEPDRVAGGFPVTPFNPPFEPTDLLVIGIEGGTVTLELPSLMPIPAGNVPQIGIFHSAGLNDPSFSGQAETPARTFSGQEYGAERTAIVEIGDTLSNFVSLGRVTFTQPTQAFANQDNPFTFPASPIPSDFSAPFTGSLSSYDGKNQPQISAMLAGSAGGTWLDVPDGALSQLTGIRFVRISAPLWQVIATGATDTHRTSNFDPDGDGPLQPKTKPADLFIDGVNVLPEPGSAAFIALGALALCRRRRRL